MRTEKTEAAGLGKIVYVVVWKDRHSDTSVYVFGNKDTAISWAREKAREYDRHGDFEEAHPVQTESVCEVYRATYSCEGDGLTVHECRVLESGW